MPRLATVPLPVPLRKTTLRSCNGFPITNRQPEAMTLMTLGTAVVMEHNKQSNLQLCMLLMAPITVSVPLGHSPDYNTYQVG